MAEWLESMKGIASLAAGGKAILGGAGGLALFSAAGVIPRVGFVRALTLRWGSFFANTYPLSVRRNEIEILNETILFLPRGRYIAVVGGKGMGKSCLIDTVLNRRHVVVKISVSCILYSIVYVTVDLNF